MCQKDSKNKQQYIKNLELFQQDIKISKHSKNHNKTQQKVISFHEAFDYAAEEYGFTICAEVLVGGKNAFCKRINTSDRFAKTTAYYNIFAAEDEGKNMQKSLQKKQVGKCIF